MDAIVESATDHPIIDSIKLNEVSDKQISAVEDVCHKSNGVAESANVVPDSSEGDNVEPLTDAGVEGDADQCAIEGLEETKIMVTTSDVDTNLKENTDESTVTAVTPAESAGYEIEIPQNAESTAEIVDTLDSGSKNCHVNDVLMEEVVESEVIESSSDKVRFETEILVETNDNDVNKIEDVDAKTESESPNTILNDLGQNIELSEVLQSSNITENIENNNCPVRQEVFNKEELLDILEGNDVQPPDNQVVEILSNSSLVEAQMALQQISRLKNIRKKHETPRRRVVTAHKPTPNKEESIVNALVKDWDDDEPTEEQNLKAKETSSKSMEPQNENAVVKEESVVDSSTGDGQTPDVNKTPDEGQRQRRLSRVIKKKVIFDPDNPDTYAKSKISKSKESESEKDQHQPKKAKLEQNLLRAKSKSPVSKMQWKKPPPKNSKQHKRLTEVDKLLMDEGAVNMIYQLTPEAPKGKKNMKTKAEFIKKLQSSTPECKEMKFRERKKELIKCEEGEAKKILGGKQRSSLSSSVKSPSVSEDFETHSADDSIIYRRHSSSSYSSSCMSPRRLSDVETNQTLVNSSQPPKDQANVSCGDNAPITDLLQPDSSVPNEFINKDDCLSLKKKLNSKLSLALNKRKRESVKTDKQIKKKVLKCDGATEKGEIDNFKLLSLTFDERVAEICIRKSGSKYNIEVIIFSLFTFV